MKIKIILIILLSFLASLGIKKVLINKQAPSSNYSHIGGDFELDGVKGKVKLSDHKGKVVLLYFGFTTCPDICPMSLTKIKSQLKRVDKKKRSQIQTIFVSVDWKRDTPSSVQEYASYFGNDFIGLTGNVDAINKATRLFSIYYSFVDLKDSELEYTVDHTNRYYLINKDGVVHKYYSDITNDQSFIKDLNSLLD